MAEEKTQFALAEIVPGGGLERLPAQCGPYEIQVNVKQLDEKGCYDASIKPFIIRLKNSGIIYRQCDEVFFPFGTHCEFTKEEIELGKLKIRLVATGPIQVR